MFSSLPKLTLFNASQKKPDITASDLKEFPDRYITGVCQVGTKTVFNASGDKKGTVDYGKRLLVRSENQIKEIKLTEECTNSRRCTDNLLLCGGRGSIVLVNLERGEQVSVLVSSDPLSLRDTLFLQISDHENIILCNKMAGGVQGLLRYECDQAGNIKQTDKMNFPAHVTGLCASGYNPDEYIVCYRGAPSCRYKYPELQPENRFHFNLPKWLTLGQLNRVSPDTAVVARPRGGFIFKDRNTSYIAVKDEMDNTLAHWCRSDDLTGKLQQPEIGELVVLSDDETFIVNFANSQDNSKIGVFTIPSTSAIGTPTLQLRVYETNVPIQQLVVDEKNGKVIVVTTQNTVKEIPQFAPVMEVTRRAASTEQTVRTVLIESGLAVDILIAVVEAYIPLRR